MARVGRPPVLTSEQIGDAVLELGIGEFSVRRLAQHLGVAEKTLYNHATGRTGIIALGMERAMRTSPDAPRVFWDADTGWRDLLTGVADEAWRFMTAVPGVGDAIAKGIHCRVEAEYTATAGEALMDRGMTASQALESLAFVFDIAAQAYAAERRMDVPAPGEKHAERDRIAADLAPAADSPERVKALFAATVDAMREPTKKVLDRRISLLMDGIAAQYGLPVEKGGQA
jgi:hypothetical protein